VKLIHADGAGFSIFQLPDCSLCKRSVAKSKRQGLQAKSLLLEVQHFSSVSCHRKSAKDFFILASLALKWLQKMLSQSVFGRHVPKEGMMKLSTSSGHFSRLKKLIHKKNIGSISYSNLIFFP
jgi:hypothetical protein